MNKFKFLLTTLLFFSFVLSFPTLALAADLSIDCPALPTACSKSGLDPLFSNSLDGFWYPGKSITKTLNLKNSGPETREMAIKGTRTSGVGILENVMQISIVGGTTVIWSGSVADFYDQEKIGMGTFAPGADLNYNFTVFMSSGAGDEYQNQETVFDLTLGFWGEPVPTATPTPTSVPTPTPTSAPGGDGGGTVLGTGVSAPVCNDTKPGSAPTLVNIAAGVNSVTLYWSLASNPVTYYLVTYGLSSGAQTYGNPNVGDKNTTSYTVNQLSGGITYYFRVRAGNGCMPGDYSNELSATPTGGFVTGGPAAGFEQGVLGTTATTEEEQGEIGGGTTQNGEVAGAQEAKTELANWWWLILPGIGLILFLFYLRKRSESQTA